MENRIVVFKSPVNPMTKEISETDLFSYRGRFLTWGTKTEIAHEYGIAVTNTVAIVEAVDLNAEGLYEVLMFSPEEICFE